MKKIFRNIGKVLSEHDEESLWVCGIGCVLSYASLLAWWLTKSPTLRIICLVYNAVIFIAGQIGLRCLNEYENEMWEEFEESMAKFVGNED